MHADRVTRKKQTNKELINGLINVISYTCTCPAAATDLHCVGGLPVASVHMA